MPFLWFSGATSETLAICQRGGKGPGRAAEAVHVGCSAPPAATQTSISVHYWPSCVHDTVQEHAFDAL